MSKCCDKESEYRKDNGLVSRTEYGALWRAMMLGFSGRLQCASHGRILTVEQSAIINQHWKTTEYRGQIASYL